MKLRDGSEWGRALGSMRQAVSVTALGAGLIVVLGAASPSGVSAQSVTQGTLDTAETAQIADNYRACIAIELKHVDANANGRLDGNEDAEFFADGEAFCQEELQAEMAHAARIAQLDTEIDAAHAQMKATTAEIINGAKRQIGLEP